MKFILSCIFICFHVCTARFTKTSKSSLRIIGGRNATEDEFPYVVKLMLQPLVARSQANLFICTASVLTSKWSLTAGHCVVSVGQMMTSAGIQTKAIIEYQPSPKSEVGYSDVVSMAVHPGINLQSMKNDVGLLYTQPVLFAKYAKLSSIDFSTLYGQEVSIVGYGMMKRMGENPPNLPQVLEVIVKICSDSYVYPQICFAPACSMHPHDPKAICMGDSGGPAIHASGIVSINTMTDIRNCGLYPGGISRRERYDTGFEVGTATPVSPFMDWILNVIKTEISPPS